MYYGVHIQIRMQFGSNKFVGLFAGSGGDYLSLFSFPFVSWTCELVSRVVFFR